MKRNVSVALVSRANARGGGASRIAEELAEWLHGKASNVVHLCSSQVGSLKPFQESLVSAGLMGKLSSLIHRATRKMGLNELVPSEYVLSLRRIASEFDVVHFHDLNLAISPLSLQLCSQRTAVVFTAHDCSSFTGGCVYPLGCERYLATCGNCPQMESIGSRIDLTRISLTINRWLARQAKIHYVFPSRWLFDMASRTLDFANPPTVIPNGFSPEPYRFASRSDARRELGICDNRRVVIVAAHFLADPRKGVSFALGAINSVADLSPLVIFVGNPPEDLFLKLPGINFWLTGFVVEKYRLGLLFASADVFLFPSLEDNLPIMVQESMAAGTPIVGFASGGIPEMVDNMRSGWLCAPGDQAGLNANLRHALIGGRTLKFGHDARRLVRERFDFDAFGQMHLQMYERVSM